MTPFVKLFLEALLLTISAELAFGLLLRAVGGKLGFSWTRKIRWAEYVPAIIFASLLTLPFVWFVFYDFIKDRTTFAVVAELWAWLAEALFYGLFFRIDYKRALTLSFLLNLFSFLVGLLIFG